ncbi:MAG: addiction module protein [Victivallales bacterium]|nr:addiction module protein [Victivallales bacterium]
MATILEIEQMSRTEKLQAMEAIWTDLSKSDADVESPGWHADMLRETEERVARREELIVDWDVAKRELRSSVIRSSSRLRPSAKFSETGAANLHIPPPERTAIPLLRVSETAFLKSSRLPGNGCPDSSNIPPEIIAIRKTSLKV